MKFLIIVSLSILFCGLANANSLGESELCNSSICNTGLVCEVSPKELTPNQECKINKDCPSGVCLKDNNKMKCEPIKRCFRPQSLGERCNANPLCAEGECRPFNRNTLGIGECKTQAKSCKNDNECCSNECSNGQCVNSFVCKKCTRQGQRVSIPEECCEGLAKDKDNVCRPIISPVVFSDI